MSLDTPVVHNVVLVVKMNMPPDVEQGTDGELTVLTLHRYLAQRQARCPRYIAEPSWFPGFNPHFRDARLEPPI